MYHGHQQTEKVDSTNVLFFQKKILRRYVTRVATDTLRVQNVLDEVDGHKYQNAQVLGNALPI